MFVRQGDRHHPALLRLEPKYFRIAKIGHMQVENRILAILRPSSATIVAKSEILRLKGRARAARRRVPCVYSHHASLSAGTEAASVSAVDYRASGEDHDAVLFRQGDRQLFPMEQIGADCVAPTHMSPFVAERVELKEQMIFAVEVHYAIRIVRPMLTRREMKLWPVRLVIVRNGSILAPESRASDRQEYKNSRV